MDLERITKIVALKKKIPLDCEAFGVLKESLSRIVQMERLVADVITRARTHFDHKQHLHLLQDFWLSLNNSTDKAPGIPDKLWQDLGFQGVDPSTDFRGMGLLGLDQLRAFAQTNQKTAHNIWQQSKLGSAWFTFATVGINITALLYSLLVSRSADEFFYSNNPTIETFHLAYQQIFQLFAIDWVVEGAVDVMDFGRIFAKLRKEVEGNLRNYGQFASPSTK